MSETTIPAHLIWPRQVWRFWRTQFRELAVRHARERAALDAWIIEVEHELKEAGSDAHAQGRGTDNGRQSR